MNQQNGPDSQDATDQVDENRYVAQRRDKLAELRLKGQAYPR